MDTRTLRNFVVVAEEGNIRRAALRLHITQPALTRQIQSLEENVGTMLFKRTNNGMEMTPAGESLLQHAQNICAELELAKKEALRVAEHQVQQLNVGVFGSATLNVIPEILLRFSRSHPNVRTMLHNAPEEQQIQSLRNGKIHIAFDRNFLETPDIACETVLRERTLIAMPKTHRCARRQSIDLEALRHESWIGGSTIHEDALWLGALGGIPKIAQRVDDLLSALAFVAKGAGVCFAPPSLLSSGFAGVVFRPVSVPIEGSFDLRCVYLRHQRSPLLKTLLSVIREYGKDALQPASC